MIPVINNRRDRRNLYNVIDGKTYDVQITPRYNRRCCGSSHGWLATVGRKMVITLMNPFSQRRIHLPPIFNPPKGNISSDNPRYFYLWVHKVILSNDPDLSPANCVVGAIYDDFARLTFIKLGDECWTYVDTNLTILADIIFSNGLLHVIDRYGKLISVDVNIDSYVGENEVEVIMPHCLVNQSDIAYIVESRGGDILMVRRFLMKQPEHKDLLARLVQHFQGAFSPQSPLGKCKPVWLTFEYLHFPNCIPPKPNQMHLYLMREIRVFKLQRNSSVRSEWIEVKNLNGETLFLGDNHSTLLSSSEIPALKPNCIYYTDDYFNDGHSHYKEDGPLDLGVFNMDDGSFEAHYVLDPSQKQFPLAIFIMPSTLDNIP
ncbi:hypothetical protein BT93_G1526 [Corymbia citriodora subsp. variegata]|nr:hypothetical protein BT93_G1526 [Corymbia citriodora subsp. variegata]